MKRHCWFTLGVAAILIGGISAKPDPDKWKSAIERFEKADQKQPPPKKGIVFTGSSSIALWKDVGKHFPEHAVINRGFGGSSLPEVNHYLDRIVINYQPKTVVLFCGGNDLATHKRLPEQVLDDFRNFVKTIHGKLPDTRIVYISIHRPPARVSQADLISRVNTLIGEECGKNPKLAFVNVHDAMLKDGKPNPELYSDGLHPSAKAYEIWAEKLRPALK